jgi:hypothetical protein
MWIRKISLLKKYLKKKQKLCVRLQLTCSLYVLRTGNNISKDISPYIATMAMGNIQHDASQVHVDAVLNTNKVGGAAHVEWIRRVVKSTSYAID